MLLLDPCPDVEFITLPGSQVWGAISGTVPEV
jgi:hypothetical protein